MLRRLGCVAALLLVLSGRVSAQTVRTSPQVQTVTLSAWSSATALNTTQTIYAAGDAGFDATLVHLVQSSGTFSAGAITFEVSYDSTNWVTVPADAVHDPSSTTWATIAVPYTLVTSTNKPFLIHTKGFQGLRIKLSTAITGTGTVTPNITQVADPPVQDVVALSPTAANFNVTATLGAGSALAGEVAPVATTTTTDAASTCYITSAASTNSTNCKGSAGNVYGFHLVNTTSTIYYLRMYNASSAPTCSSATGFIETIPVLAATGAPGGIAFANSIPQGYGTGIGFCLTGGGSSTDNTNAATGVYVTVLYK